MWSVKAWAASLRTCHLNLYESKAHHEKSDHKTIPHGLTFSNISLLKTSNRYSMSNHLSSFWSQITNSSNTINPFPAYFPTSVSRNTSLGGRRDIVARQTHFWKLVTIIKQSITPHDANDDGDDDEDDATASHHATIINISIKVSFLELHHDAS